MSAIEWSSMDVRLTALIVSVTLQVLLSPCVRSWLSIPEDVARILGVQNRNFLSLNAFLSTIHIYSLTTISIMSILMPSARRSKSTRRDGTRPAIHKTELMITHAILSFETILNGAILNLIETVDSPVTLRLLLVELEKLFMDAFVIFWPCVLLLAVIASLFYVCGVALRAFGAAECAEVVQRRLEGLLDLVFDREGTGTTATDYGSDLEKAEGGGIDIEPTKMLLLV